MAKHPPGYAEALEYAVRDRLFTSGKLPTSTSLRTTKSDEVEANRLLKCCGVGFVRELLKDKRVEDACNERAAAKSRVLEGIRSTYPETTRAALRGYVKDCKLACNCVAPQLGKSASGRVLLSLPSEQRMFVALHAFESLIALERRCSFENNSIMECLAWKRITGDLCRGKVPAKDDELCGLVSLVLKRGKFGCEPPDHSIAQLIERTVKVNGLSRKLESAVRRLVKEATKKDFDLRFIMRLEALLPMRAGRGRTWLGAGVNG